MTVTPNKYPRALPVAGIATAVVLATSLAIRLAGIPGGARPQASPATVGVASEQSATRPKARVRYQATIDNWRRYRETARPD